MAKLGGEVSHSGKLTVKSRGVVALGVTHWKVRHSRTYFSASFLSRACWSGVWSMSH
ncbi:hypothetical protein [Rubritalea tangerina]|uniref:hypothetical protein n=1 Tax=Rubritalea tangerina TaxID=430798 RepID=UPI00360EE321